MKVLFVLTVTFGLATAASFLGDGGFKPESRIINGERAKKGMFPYLVGLILTKGSSNAWCGGSLISENWVVTAAHCTYGRESAVVYLGAVERNKPVQTVATSEFHIHEKYDPDFVFYDISLIKLPTPAILIPDVVELVVLPRRLAPISNYYGDTAITSGWGRISDTNSSVVDDLYFIFREVSPNSVCAAVYGFGTVNDAQLCVNTRAATNHQSTCNGDSGGPLVLNDYQRTLIGLTSYGHKNGCDKGYPAVFVRVTSYLEWIKTVSGVYNN